MKLSVPYINDVDQQTRIEDISVILDKIERHVIQQLPWPEFSYKPQVSFSIGHTGDCILLKYFVREKTIRAVQHADNTPVHEDSCVEFFIGFNGDEGYYNFEFNCKSACLLGFGKNVAQRQLIQKDIVGRIRRQASIKIIKEGMDNPAYWDLTLMIPVSVFASHDIDSLSNRHCRVNFYKCGDKLPEPHFLSWHPIKASAPDFHLPAFFGDAYFK